MLSKGSLSQKARCYMMSFIGNLVQKGLIHGNRKEVSGCRGPGENLPGGYGISSLGDEMFWH